MAVTAALGKDGTIKRGWVSIDIDSAEYALQIAHDRKTTPLWGVHSAFGLLAIETCPLATSACKAVCYASNAQSRYSGTQAALAHNTDTTREIIARHGAEGLARAFTAILERFASDVDAAERKAGRALSRAFRWGWSGDIESPDYARAIALAHLAVPVDRATGYLYTRSVYFVHELLPAIRAKALNVMLSADNVNIKHVTAFRAQFEREYGVRLALFAFANSERAQGVACPAIAYPDRLPLAAKAGDISPCARCRMCTDVNRKPIDVVVSIHK